MKGTEKSLSDFLRYFGILGNKNRKVHRKIQGKSSQGISAEKYREILREIFAENYRGISAPEL